MLLATPAGPDYTQFTGLGDGSGRVCSVSSGRSGRRSECLLSLYGTPARYSRPAVAHPSSLDALAALGNCRGCVCFPDKGVKSKYQRTGWRPALSEHPDDRCIQPGCVAPLEGGWLTFTTPPPPPARPRAPPPGSLAPTFVSDQALIFDVENCPSVRRLQVSAGTGRGQRL